MTEFHRSWVEIDAERLAANFRAVQAAAAGAEVLAVIKADGYGHSAELCAPVLARAGARWFGVTDAAEGAQVRRVLERAGFSGVAAPEILVMSGSLEQEAATIAEFRLTPVVWTVEQVRALRSLSHIRVHIEVDTGMGRQGARPGEELPGVLAAPREFGVGVGGLFTHLCSSEVARSDATAMQKERFQAAVEQAVSSGLSFDWLHIANSSAVDNPAEIDGWMAGLAQRTGARRMVRAGLALYGHVLPIAQTGDDDDLVLPQLEPKLLPVLTWKARVLAVRELDAGETVGYGATFVAPAAMRVALLPVGYADGFRRELSNPGTKRGEEESGWVIATDSDGAWRRCPVLGRVSMNLTVVDVSCAPWVKAGDVVTLLGAGITADDHARIAGTISYEILCSLRGSPHVLVNEAG